MGINVTFYRFSKKTNSTKIPYTGQTVFTFEASQEGTGNPSPTNIRPIVPGFSLLRDDGTTLDVYGGSLDVTSGVLTVTWESRKIVDMVFRKEPTCQHTFRCLSSDRKYGTNNFNILAPVFKTSNQHSTVSNISALESENDFTIFINSGSFTFYISTDSTYDNKTYTDFQTDFGDIYLVYELAQPVTIQLTYTELKRCCDQLGIPYPVHIPVTYQAYDCELLDNTTIQNPGIRLDMYGGTASPFDFNYAYIPQFQRYYWVNAIEYDLGTWIFSLEVDVLGSLRDKIGSSEQYIMRSSADYDGTITDSTYPIKNAFDSETVIESEETIFGSVAGLDAWYVVGIIGGLSGEAYAYYTNLHLTPSELYNGSVIYFVLDNAQLRELMQMLLGSANIYGIDSSEMSEALAKQLLNPIQYIESIRCVPFKPDVMSYNDNDILVDKIQFGFSLLDINDVDPEPTPPVPPNEVEDEEITPQAVQAGWRILRRPRITYPLRNISTGEGWIRHHSFTMPLPVHPQKARGAWVKGAPTSSYTIEMEPFGMIQIPGNVPIQARESSVIIEPGVTIRAFMIKFEAWTDVVTGMCKLIISFQDSENNWHPFYNDSRDISVTLPCHQSIQDASSYFRTWTSMDAQSQNFPLQVISSLFGGGVSGGGNYQAGQGAGGSIGVGTGLATGIFAAGQTVNNYYRAAKPQAQLSMLEANMPRISGNGASGGSYVSFASDFCSPRVHCYFSLLTADNLYDHGRPLCAFRTISAIPGYIECDHAHLNDDDIPLTAIEREDALNFMNGGFYYE